MVNIKRNRRQELTKSECFFHRLSNKFEQIRSRSLLIFASLSENHYGADRHK